MIVLYSTYEWLTHGVFEIMLGAEDIEGNTHEIEISVRIDMHAVWTETNTNSNTMEFLMQHLIVKTANLCLK